VRGSRLVPFPTSRSPHSSGDRASASGAVCAGSNPAGGAHQILVSAVTSEGLRGSTHANLYRYGMTIMRDVHELSVTEATQRGVAGLVAEAEQGADVVVTRRNHPVAAVVGIARLEFLEAAESDLRDLALVLTRAATDRGRRAPRSTMC
jgi:prevent-host-death family protein